MASSSSCQDLEGEEKPVVPTPPHKGKQRHRWVSSLHLSILCEVKNLRAAQKAKQLPDQNLNIMPSPHSLSPWPRRKTYQTFKYLLTHMEETDF